MPRASLLLGIDLGTSGVKVGLFDADGRPVAWGEGSYPIGRPEPDAAEQDAEEWWRTTSGVLRQVMAHASGAGQIVAVAVGGQGPTVVAADEALRPTYPAVTWLDSRVGPETALLFQRLGQPVPVWGSWTGRALWLAEHRPEAFSRTRWLLTSWDYLAARLTGVPRSASRVPDAELRAAGLDPALVPPAVEPLDVVGEVSQAAAAETGIPAGVPVVAGMVDGLLGVVGSGAQAVGQACINAGTSGTVSAIAPAPLGWPVLGFRVVGAGINAHGKVLEWFRTELAPDLSSYETLLEAAAVAPPGAGGLLFLPYLAGERAPHADPRARAAYVGLTLRHTRAHLARAALEGVAFAFRQVIAETIAPLGVQVREVRIVGGAARSPLWSQIQADVLERPVLVPQVTEGAVLGAAMVAGTGVGCFADLASAAEQMVRVAQRCEPDPGRQALYTRLYESYVELYPALRAVSWRLADVERAALAPASAPSA